MSKKEGIIFESINVLQKSFDDKNNVTKNNSKDIIKNELIKLKNELNNIIHNYKLLIDEKDINLIIEGLEDKLITSQNAFSGKVSNKLIDNLLMFKNNGLNGNGKEAIIKSLSENIEIDSKNLKNQSNKYFDNHYLIQEINKDLSFMLQNISSDNAIEDIKNDIKKCLSSMSLKLIELNNDSIEKCFSELQISIENNFNNTINKELSTTSEYDEYINSLSIDDAIEFVNKSYTNLAFDNIELSTYLRSRLKELKNLKNNNASLNSSSYLQPFGEEIIEDNKDQLRSMFK